MKPEEGAQHEPGEKRVDPAADVETVASPRRPDEISDVALAESETGKAPTFRAPVAPPPAVGKPGTPHAKPLALLPGAKVDDFEIVRMLGRGAFGHVYLARQVSNASTSTIQEWDLAGTVGRLTITTATSAAFV